MPPIPTFLCYVSILLKESAWGWGGVGKGETQSCGKLILIRIFWDCPIVGGFHHLAPCILRTNRQDHSFLGGGSHTSQSCV